MSGHRKKLIEIVEIQLNMKKTSMLFAKSLEKNKHSTGLYSLKHTNSYYGFLSNILWVFLLVAFIDYSQKKTEETIWFRSSKYAWKNILNNTTD